MPLTFLTIAIFWLSLLSPIKEGREIVSLVFEGSNDLTKLYVNELMSSNDSIQDENGDTGDWVEIYNSGDESLNLSRLYISDDEDDLKKFKFGPNLSISPGGFVLLWADDNPSNGSSHLSFKLDAEGEGIFISHLVQGVPTLIDGFYFDAIPSNVSYGRADDGSSELITIGNPSPGASNSGSLRFLSSPEISLPNGKYMSALEVELAIEDGATIRYTLDGSDPTQDSPEYVGPLNISETTLLKAKGFKSGFQQSIVESRFFVFSDHGKLPILSISTHPDNLWDDEKGIYTKGTNGIAISGFEPGNYFQDWECDAQVSMIETDGTEIFHENIGIALAGNASRVATQKSFSFHFRKKYGAENLKHKLFGSIDEEEFGHFKLRNSGQDFRGTKLRDAIISGLLINEIDVDVLAFRPAVLYLNGEYWGWYNLRESFTDEYIEEHFDSAGADADIITGRWPNIIADQGSTKDYLELYDFIEASDLNVPDNYDFIDSKMDINEFMNYQITQIYIGNQDWPTNNVIVWRTSSEGKWRWHLFDTDITTNFSSGMHPAVNSLVFATSDTSELGQNKSSSTLFLRKLLMNETFKNEFIQRMCTYPTSLFLGERVASFTDETSGIVEFEMPRQTEKWSQSYPYGIWKTTGGSYDKWLSNLSSFKNYFHERPSHMYEHLGAYFDLGNMYNLEINVSDQSQGSVALNSNKYKIPSDFKGKFFDNLGLQIEAIPNEGYVFVKWIETGNTDASILLVTASDTQLTPLFELDILGSLNGIETNQSIIYPNPISSNWLNIDLNNLLVKDKIEIQILNLTGQIILSKSLGSISKMRQIELDISDLKPATYLIQFNGAKSKYSEMFIRQ